MNIRYEYKDVTETLEEYVNIHCISEDCAMGSGVVVAYNKKMPKLKESCMKYMQYPLRNTRGYILPYKYTQENKIIYNMFTKEKYWHNAYKGMNYSEYIKRLELSLEFIKDDMTKNNLCRLAMPKIGCGRDRLDWDTVEDIIHKIFDNTNIEILVCEFKE